MQYEGVTNRLKAAQEALARLQQEKATAIQGFTDQYATLPAITPGEGTGQEQLAAYLQALKDQTAAVATYRATLDQLRKLGHG